MGTAFAEALTIYYAHREELKSQGIADTWPLPETVMDEDGDPLVMAPFINYDFSKYCAYKDNVEVALKDAIGFPRDWRFEAKRRLEWCDVFGYKREPTDDDLGSTHRRVYEIFPEKICMRALEKYNEMLDTDGSSEFSTFQKIFQSSPTKYMKLNDENKSKIVAA